MVRFLSSCQLLSASVLISGIVEVPIILDEVPVTIYRVSIKVPLILWLLTIDLSINYLRGHCKALKVEIKVSWTSTYVSCRPQLLNKTWKLTQ